MKRLVCAVLVLTGVLTTAAGAGAGGPITKQNGSVPVFASFTSICAVPGYVDYGNCEGSTGTFANVAGRIDAVQSKLGRYNLDFSFTGLTPGYRYQLHGNDGAFFLIGATAADDSGAVRFSFQTTAPVGLGFDLNTVGGDVTIVTSYWSGQLLAKRADGTLYVP
jgi:hypothetical protein